MPSPRTLVGPGRLCALENGFAIDDQEGIGHGWASLTDAELRVVACVVRGMSNRAIAGELHVSRHTVDAHLKHVYLKLGIHSRVALAVQAVQQRRVHVS